MRYIAFIIGMLASPAASESLCNQWNVDVVRSALAGEWSMRGATSIETETFSTTQATIGRTIINEAGQFASVAIVEGAPIPSVTIGPDSNTMWDFGPVYDVDGVDDMLDTVEAEWIADAVSMTPCGPRSLLQLKADVSLGEQGSGTVTFIPYFTDQIVVISEAELPGSWGYAFITSVELLTREAP